MSNSDRSGRTARSEASKYISPDQSGTRSHAARCCIPLQTGAIRRTHTGTLTFHPAFVGHFDRFAAFFN